jgi:predicted DNA-binding transcriptional regulator AlpA
MENITTIPETGFFRLSQIIGQKAVSPEEAEANRLKAEQDRAAGRKTKAGPRFPRPAIPAIVPWSKSKLWDAVKKGEFPAPVKLSSRTTAWTVRSIKDFCQKQA